MSNKTYAGIPLPTFLWWLHSTDDLITEWVSLIPKSTDFAAALSTTEIAREKRGLINERKRRRQEERLRSKALMEISGPRHSYSLIQALDVAVPETMRGFVIRLVLYLHSLQRHGMMMRSLEILLRDENLTEVIAMLFFCVLCGGYTWLEKVLTHHLKSSPDKCLLSSQVEVFHAAIVAWMQTWFPKLHEDSRKIIWENVLKDMRNESNEWSLSMKQLIPLSIYLASSMGIEEHCDVKSGSNVSSIPSHEWIHFFYKVMVHENDVLTSHSETTCSYMKLCVQLCRHLEMLMPHEKNNHFLDINSTQNSTSSYPDVSPRDGKEKKYSLKFVHSKVLIANLTQVKGETRQKESDRTFAPVQQRLKIASEHLPHWSTQALINHIIPLTSILDSALTHERLTHNDKAEMQSSDHWYELGWIRLRVASSIFRIFLHSNLTLFIDIVIRNWRLVADDLSFWFRHLHQISIFFHGLISNANQSSEKAWEDTLPSDIYSATKAFHKLLQCYPLSVGKFLASELNNENGCSCGVQKVKVLTDALDNSILAAKHLESIQSQHLMLAKYVSKFPILNLYVRRHAQIYESEFREEPTNRLTCLQPPSVSKSTSSLRLNISKRSDTFYHHRSGCLVHSWESASAKVANL